MPEVKEHPAGDFCWIELATTEPKSALEFYQRLFGWQVKDIHMGEGEPYRMWQWNGKDFGAMYELVAEQKQRGVPPHWLSYVSVKDVEATAAKAKSLGGEVLMGPMDVSDAGRMAILQDAQGAVFALWQPRGHIGAVIAGEYGTFCWMELATHDTQQAGEFYTGLFGWQAETQQMESMAYTSFLNQGRPVGGMLEIGKDWGEVPPHWLVYFRVEDCDRTTEKATAGGATLLSPPRDIPEVGRFAVLRDPQGAVFAVIRLQQMTG